MCVLNIEYVDLLINIFYLVLFFCMNKDDYKGRYYK